MLDEDQLSRQSNEEKKQYLTSVCAPSYALKRIQEEYEKARYHGFADCRRNNLDSAELADDRRHSSGLGSSGLGSPGLGSPGLGSSGLGSSGLSSSGSDSSVVVLG